MAPTMLGIALTYHSHHVLSNEYATNDHIALATDLVTITRLGFPIVAATDLATLLSGDSGPKHLPPDAPLLVAITFDDGPLYDFSGFDHPQFGWQKGFLPILQEFLASPLGRSQPSLCGTSFVIASPRARAEMEAAFDPDYTFLAQGALTDQWWNDAIDSGLIQIANHSWDHLHPGIAAVTHSRGARGDFSQVDNLIDANAQIAVAQDWIDARTHGRAAPLFAFPFGHYNDYLVDEYLPALAERRALLGAFTTRGGHIDDRTNRWAIPRITCGHDWVHPDGLATLLLRAAYGGEWK